MVLRMARAIARYIGFGEDDAVALDPELSTKPMKTAALAQRPTLTLMKRIDSREEVESHRWRRHPQLREYEAPITTDVRTARHEAVRGLCAARAGANDVAINHFAIAARCADVDITAVPGFWSLTRGQMQMAVDAYDRVGRIRDAAALDAQIATIFRPSLVGVKSVPVQPREQHKQAAST